MTAGWLEFEGDATRASLAGVAHRPAVRRVEADGGQQLAGLATHPREEFTGREAERLAPRSRCDATVRSFGAVGEKEGDAAHVLGRLDVHRREPHRVAEPLEVGAGLAGDDIENLVGQRWSRRRESLRLGLRERVQRIRAARGSGAPMCHFSQGGASQGKTRQDRGWVLLAKSREGGLYPFLVRREVFIYCFFSAL